MRLLLDTHSFVWSILKVANLSANSRKAVEDEASTVFVSVASAWEIAIKVGLGKWPDAETLLGAFEARAVESGFVMLPITVAHARTSGLMQHPHRDPFDRLLVAQALVEGLTIVTSDSKVHSMAAPCLW